MRNRNTSKSEASDDDLSAEPSLCPSFEFSSAASSSEGALPAADCSPPITEVAFGSSNTTCATESTVSSLETCEDVLPDDLVEEDDREHFQVGDHVYTWCSLLALPRAYQHHGIVIGVDSKHVKIVDFYPIFYNHENEKNANNNDNNKKTTSSGSSSGAFASSPQKGRTFTMSELVLDHATAQKKWKRVQYDVPWTHRLLRRSGTCSTVAADSVGFCLSRIEMLRDHGHYILPTYDEFASNCECVAVWCKTGIYSSLQGSALLGAVANGSLKATALASLGVSATSVSVPCAGVWGWLGFTTTVPLATAVPLLLPAIVAGGVASTIPPLVLLQRCKQEWKETTESLNHALGEACRRGLYLPHIPRY